MSQQKTQLVWFKRDLRVQDHAPLAEAAKRGPCLCLYVYEPEVYTAEDFDSAKMNFINDSLRDLALSLKRLGGRLTFRVGTLPQAFEELYDEYPFEAIWSHEETGNDITYRRDQRVSAWANEKGIALHQLPQNGVVRGLKSRDGWSRLWQQRMNESTAPMPEHVTPVEGLTHGRRRSLRELGLPESTRTDVQHGGESLAHETLETFLTDRGVNYRSDMSSPLTGEQGCSRLSTYLAWGNISIKQVYHAVTARSQELKDIRKAKQEIDKRWLPSLSSYQGRLRWHCHFMQKYEDEPRIEFENINRGYDGLRENEFNEEYFQRWCEGRTGYPFVDACIRALHQTGWTNFRMRAMLVSFASYHLWLHWRRPALYLAQQFLDFEPGIHYSQFQMQSGVTGINTVRIYSPTKQAQDQDPEGIFIRRYVPELSGVPTKHIAEPHKMAQTEQRKAGCIIGKDYPAPIVDHKEATKAAKQRVYAVKGNAKTKAESQKVYEKHGSRRRPSRPPRKKTPKKSDWEQGTLLDG
ncbi:MAG: FAD-binding domain-containing protein [Gemmataceae bacterium]